MLLPFLLFFPQIYYNWEKDVTCIWEKHATKTGKKTSAYDIVKSLTENTLGKFSKQDALFSCPSLGSSSVESALKKLVEEGAIYSACISTDFSVLFYCLNPR